MVRGFNVVFVSFLTISIHFNIVDVLIRYVYIDTVVRHPLSCLTPSNLPVHHADAGMIVRSSISMMLLAHHPFLHLCLSLSALIKCVDDKDFERLACWKSNLVRPGVCDEEDPSSALLLLRLLFCRCICDCLKRSRESV